MTLQVRPRLLLTVRDPGPAGLIANAVSELKRGFLLHLLCAPRDRAFLPRSLEVPWIPVDPEDEVERACRDALRDTRPDLILRTTPAYGIGVDETIAGVASELPRPPKLYCLQDHYGLGHKLESVHRLGVMDALSRECVTGSAAWRVDVLGWLAHERFLTGPSWSSARNKARRKMRLTGRETAAAYVAICSNSIDADHRDLIRVLDAARSIEGDSRWCIRPHPRMRPEEVDRFRRTLVASGLKTIDTGQLDDEREWLAGFDTLVSPASAMLIDALAFFLSEHDAPRIIGGGPATVGLYLVTPESLAAMRGASGLDRFPTHLPGRGFAVAGPLDLEHKLGETLHSPAFRRECLLSGLPHFRPKAGCALRVRGWLEGALT